MNDLATYAYPFMLSIVALVAGWLLLARRARDESGQLPRALFAAGVAAAVIGFLLVLWGASQ